MRDKEARWEIEDLEARCKMLEDRYWKLWHDLNALTDHFGLDIVQKPSTIVVQKKKEN